MKNPQFAAGYPVWLKGMQTRRHTTAGFVACGESDGSGMTLRVATSGYYRVFVDGVFAAWGPARCARGFYRVDELALPVAAGFHYVAVEVVNYYINSFSSLMQPGFIQMELLQGDRVLAATGRDGFRAFLLTDRVRKMQRYSYQRPMGESYRLSRHVYDWRVGAPGDNAQPRETELTEKKQLVDRGIAPFFYPEIAPETVLSRGTLCAGVKPVKYRKDRSLTRIGDPALGQLGGWKESELELHLSDEIQEHHLTSLETVEEAYSGASTLKTGELEILALAGEKTGFVTMEIQCLASGTLYFMMDETLQPDGDVDALSMECLNAVRLDVEEGTYSFRTMEPYGFKYIKLVCADGAFRVENLRVTQMICPEPVIRSYTGGDPVLAEIFTAARDTFLQNSSDLFMDCPTRERAGWLCDAFFTARTEAVLTGRNAVERNFLENFRLAESFPHLPEGMLPMCYPSDVLNGDFIPNWAMWFVLQLEDHMLRTGDRAFVQSFRDRIHGLLNWFAQYENRDGLLEKLPGWIFVEWSRANDLVQDINFPTNMVYARMLRAAAAVLEEPAWICKAERLEECIRRRSFDGMFFRDHEVYCDGIAVIQPEATEVCQYYAFFTGIATAESHPELWERLLRDFGPDRQKRGLWTEIAPCNMFVGQYLRLELLRKKGLYSRILEECVGYFHYMARKTGTLWENVTDHASCNHGFASYAAVLILEAEENR